MRVLGFEARYLRFQPARVMIGHDQKGNDGVLIVERLLKLPRRWRTPVEAPAVRCWNGWMQGTPSALAPGDVIQGGLRPAQGVAPPSPQKPSCELKLAV